VDDAERALLEGMAMVIWPDPPPQIWRLYYDDQGLPLFYSQEDLPGKYVAVTPEQYVAKNFRVRVVDGNLQEYQRRAVRKLIPGQYGTPCHPGDVSLVVDTTLSHCRWKLENEIKS
jgi:hypothetical protein